MKRRLAVGVALAAALTLSSCTRTVVVHDTPAASTAAAVAADTPTPAPSFDYSTAGLVASLKIKAKACFGSAGCNVTVAPEFVVTDPSAIPDSASGSVTYEVDGGTDGPVIDTATFTGSTYSVSEAVVSTASSSVVLTIKITDITTS